MPEGGGGMYVVLKASKGPVVYTGKRDCSGSGRKDGGEKAEVCRGTKNKV